ncbi:hypothetical protein PPUJ13061_47680 [Pseudomonas putida]|nr:hypothetical protein PPUJ13061_47680 [Pseudomonas putida]
MYRDVEQLPWAALVDERLKVFGIPLKHLKLLGVSDPIHLGTGVIVGKDLPWRWDYFVIAISFFCNFGTITLDEALQSSGFYPGHFARHCAHVKLGARYDR